MSAPKSTNNSGRIRRGLVLAGGGAKGAYQFGCMLALKRLGYEFDVVAGTSVGALNAVLWSTNSLRKGLQLWCNLSFAGTFPVRLAHRVIPAIFLWVTSFAQVFANLVGAVFRRHPHAATKHIALVLALLHSAITYACYAAVALVFRDAEDIWWKTAGLLVALNGAALYDALRNHEESANSHLLMGPFAAVSLPLFSGVVGPVIADRSSIWGPIAALAATLLFAVAVALLVAAVALTFQFIRWITKPLRRMTVFSSAKLRELLGEIVSKGWQCPTLATSAKARDIVDLTQPISWSPTRYEKDHHDIRTMVELGFAKRATRPLTKRVWQPCYELVSDCPHGEAVDWLVASAALPFGLAPPISIANEFYVDGGVADNLPWYPLIEFNLDEIVVVLLQKFPDEDAAREFVDATVDSWLAKTAFIEICRDFESAKPVLPEEQAEAEKELRATRAERSRLFQEAMAKQKFPQFRIIFPDHDLGGIISGTLRFDMKYSKSLLRRGLTDGYRFGRRWVVD